MNDYNCLFIFFNFIGLFSSGNFFPGSGCAVPADIALGLGMGVSALRHCRRRKARTVFSDPQLTGLEKRFEAQRLARLLLLFDSDLITLFLQCTDTCRHRNV